MGFCRILKLDIYKLVKKKTTYLLFLTLLIPLIFGVGMSAQVSFLVNDGGNSFDVISDKGISALQFTANMLSQSTYVVYLIVIIIASMAVANELETGQIRLYIVRICTRPKMVISKILSLFLLIAGYMVIYSLFSIVIYYLFVSGTKYGNGALASDSLNSVLYLLVTFVGIIVVTGITVLLGMVLKTFHCFAVAYLVWFVAKYLSFFDKFKLVAPDNCADVIMANGISTTELLKWLVIYLVYIVVSLLVACYVFTHKDIK